ncbi:MAG: hypothetical protein ACOC3Z_00690 [Nanoarchaeota archaeon]
MKYSIRFSKKDVYLVELGFKSKISAQKNLKKYTKALLKTNETAQGFIFKNNNLSLEYILKKKDNKIITNKI